MAWFSSEEVTDPSSDAILADTGQLGLGVATITILVFTTYTSTVYIELRNATNDATLNSQPIVIGSGSDVIRDLPFSVGANQRIRLRLGTGFTGTIWASILTQ